MEKERKDKWVEEGLEKLSKLGEREETEISPPKTEEVQPVAAVSSAPKTERDVYKCRGKDCGFQTLDLGDFIQHTIDERLAPIHSELAKLREAPKTEAPQKVEEPRWEGEKPKTHSTVKEYLDCPDCAPKFEKELLARGWKKPEEKPATTTKKEGLAV